MMPGQPSTIFTFIWDNKHFIPIVQLLESASRFHFIILHIKDQRESGRSCTFNIQKSYEAKKDDFLGLFIQFKHNIIWFLCRNLQYLVKSLLYRMASPVGSFFQGYWLGHLTQVCMMNCWPGSSLSLASLHELGTRQSVLGPGEHFSCQAGKFLAVSIVTGSWIHWITWVWVTKYTSGWLARTSSIQ